MGSLRKNLSASLRPLWRARAIRQAGTLRALALRESTATEQPPGRAAGCADRNDREGIEIIGKAELTLNDLLRQYPPPIRETVDRLRGIVHAIAPGAREKVNRGWRSINYLDPQVGYFCGIFPFEDRVDLIFEFGTLLPDPERMLEGEAKQTRYLRFRRPNDIRVQPTKAFIRAALALPPEHSTRRGLIQSKASPSHLVPAGQKRKPRTR